MTLKPSRTDSYEITIAGLLTKRSELLGDIQLLRDRVGTVTEDIASIDRVLDTLGYEGDREVVAPIGTRLVLFQRNELQHQLLHILRMADRPLTSRDIAIQIVTQEGRDRCDNRLVLDVVKRAGKTLGILRRRGQVDGRRDENGRHVWTARQSVSPDSN